MKLHLWIAAIAAAAVLGGCTSEGNKPEDSMAKILEQGKKDQGITEDKIIPKNEMGKKVDEGAKAKAKDAKTDSNGVGAPTDSAPK